MPSKNQKNGLTMYISMVLQPEYLAREGRNYSLKEMIHIAHPRYQALPKSEKERFDRLAKEARANERGALNSHQDNRRRDNIGNIISERVDEVNEMNKMRTREKRELMSEFQMLDTDLLEKKFYFIGVQYMVVLDETEYLPLEFGLVEWSMNSGVTNEYHTFINPGEIPIGYRFKAIEHSDETHKIPLEKFTDGSTDYKSIWMNLERFLNPRNQGKFPPVYCMLEEYKKVFGCLEWLHNHAAIRRPNDIKVNILEDLTETLYAHQNQNLSSASIIDMLSTSAFDYEQNTKCDFHDDTEAKHCALGCPKKYTYVLSDALVMWYDFTLTQQHLPVVQQKNNGCIVVEPSMHHQGPKFSNPPPLPPMGRGTTYDSECSTNFDSEFPARDIRYFPTKASAIENGGRNRDTQNEFRDFENDLDEFPALGTTNLQPIQKFANTMTRAPAASALPTPDSALFRQPSAMKPTLNEVIQAKRIADGASQMMLVEPTASDGPEIDGSVGQPNLPGKTVSDHPGLMELLSAMRAKSITSSVVGDTDDMESHNNWDQMSTISSSINSMSLISGPASGAGSQLNFPIGRGRGFGTPVGLPKASMDWNNMAVVAGRGRRIGKPEAEDVLGGFAVSSAHPPGLDGYGRGVRGSNM